MNHYEVDIFQGFVMWIGLFWQMLIISWLPDWLTYNTAGSLCS